MKIKGIFMRMLSMCPEAWYIFRRSLQLCIFLLLCAFALLLEFDGTLLEHYSLYMSAMSLVELTQAILLIAVFASVFIEDVYTSR